MNPRLLKRLADLEHRVRRLSLSLGDQASFFVKIRFF